MNIRPATRNDLPACATLDGSYQSSWVWQMEAPAQRIPQGEGEEIQVGFRTTRLPRKLEVPHRLDPIVLEWDWQHEECFLVAEEAEQVLGLLDMRIQPWERVGWVYQLVVDRPRRRQRRGSRRQ